MKFQAKSIICWTLLAGLSLAGGRAWAQTRAYGQINLSGSDPGLATHVTPGLINPWGMAFLPGQPFFIANTNSGRVLAQPPAGSVVGFPGFLVVNPVNNTPSTPTGIVVDANSYFGSTFAVQPFITATLDGGIYYWGPDARGDFAVAATLARDRSSTGAVYTGIGILAPSCCNPFLGVINFHAGDVESYTTTFAPLAPPGNFVDPELPAGYAPFGMQVIGSQVFITYAVQDATQHGPVIGAGKGLVDIFDLEGNFVERYAQNGPLNAPWGVTKASANFGPFSNAILVGNFGDGIINAFDPLTGDLEGQIRDPSGIAIANPGLHALTFRFDGLGDPNTLYITAGINDGTGGLFGAIRYGLPSTINLLAPDTPTNTPATFTATVFTGPLSNGIPTGTVDFTDGGTLVGTAPVVNEEARLTTTLTGVGLHIIQAQYSGDATFLPTKSQTEMHVTGPATTTILSAPSNAIPNSPVTLRATTSAASGTPTGSIQFRDQNAVLGTAPLSGGVATLTISNLSPGVHAVVAVYSGDGNFSGSTSAVDSITISAGDFQLGATPPDITVIAGQSAMFTVTVTPSGGFADAVNFSCQAPAGITCSFASPTVNVAGVVSTVMTATTSATAAGYGRFPDSRYSGLLITALMLMGFVLLGHNNRAGGARRIRWAGAAGVLAVVALSLTLVACGGYSNPTQPYRAPSSIMVTAHSSSVSHSTVVNVTVR